MELLVKNIFVILHIITGAAWFGMGLRLTAKARNAIAAAEAGGAILADDTRRTVRFMGYFIVLTFVFGLVAIFLGGGFGFYDSKYHTSILLVLILVALQFALIAPSWGKLHGALASAPVDLGAAEQLRKRIAMSTGIAHLLWLVVLVLMLWNQYPLAF